MIAILIAFMAFAYASSITTSANTTNNTLGLQIIVNNTNLAPHVVGESNGTGERIAGTTYFNNNSDIELFIWGHAATPSQTAEIHLFINGTKVSDTSGRPVGATEQSNKTIVAIIPRYASYMIEVQNTHHYEWREYLILSGNVTSTLNQTDNDTQYINKTGDTVGDATDTFCLTISNSTSSLCIAQAGIVYLSGVTNNQMGFDGGFELTKNASPYFNSDETGTTISGTNGLNMSGKNISNCGNCSEFSKLIKTTSYISGAVITGSTTIPHDDTIPQFNEGNFFANLTITPASQTSKIKACSQVVMSTSATAPNLLQTVMFINGSSNAVAISGAYSPAQFYEVNTGVCYTTQVPSAAAFNVSVRYGSNAAGTVTVNGASGARSYGGTYNSYIIVDEYKD